MFSRRYCLRNPDSAYALFALPILYAAQKLFPTALFLPMTVQSPAVLAWSLLPRKSLKCLQREDGILRMRVGLRQ